MINLKDKILNNQKLIISAIIGICILLSDFYFIIKPVVGGLIKIIPDVSTKASRVKIINADIKNVPNYENQIKNLEAQLSRYKRQFSTKEEISPLLKNLSDTAKTYGVKIVTINPLENLEQGAQAKIQSAYSKFPIFLSAISGYHSFGLFLSKLENSDTFMRVADIKIAGDIAGSGNHKFDAIIVTYILGQTEEAREETKK